MPFATGRIIYLVSSHLYLINKEAEEAGRVLVSFWVAQLIFGFPSLSQEDWEWLLRLPVEPLAMFRLEAVSILQQAQESWRFARVFSRTIAQWTSVAGEWGWEQGMRKEHNNATLGVSPREILMKLQLTQ